MGETTIGMMTFWKMPAHFTVAEAASAAPARPPMSACEEDEGRPYHHVSRFQPMAPIRAAATIISPIVPWGGSMIPLPTVSATFLPKKAPKRLRDGRHEQGDPGGQRPRRDRGRDGVGRVVESVGVVEAHRKSDDDAYWQPFHDGQDSLTAMLSTLWATCSKASAAASSSSMTSLCFMIVIASVGWPLNSSASRRR